MDRDPIDVDSKLCPQCQLVVPAAAKRCGHCGARFGEFRNELIIAGVLVAMIVVLVVFNLASR